MIERWILLEMNETPVVYKIFLVWEKMKINLTFAGLKRKWLKEEFSVMAM